ncbi:COG4223 family protein [Neotabrizicola shimadae]|uniref:Mitochondrial inner membrane protein n=1 Tax=Neotabrizicola shimadae TaxID=2807096 RepID=A0A8G0ZVX2_9RHOB|nr:hypothetical protein [Neotabrizicola shimadae]QYZ69861.1 hypothetical protein JO391_19585 [Neotabrizicola shimadae]
MSDKDSPQTEAQDDVLKAVEDSDPARTDDTPEAEVKPVVTPEPVPPAADVPPVPPSPARPATPPAPPPRRSGALMGGVIGAVLALGAGYAALRYGPPDLLPMPAAAGLTESLATTEQEISALKAQIAELPAPVTVDPLLIERVSALEAAVASAQTPAAPDLSGIESRLAALEARVTALSDQPPASAAAGTGALPADAAQAIAALQAEVAALKSNGGAASEAMSAQAAEVKAQLEAAQAEAQKLAEASAAAAKAALAGAALSRLQAALDSGVPYEGALGDLGLDPVPEALAAHAATGVPTLQLLTDSFPDAARAALEASLKAQMGAGWTDRALTFLRTETGIRSLDPREGNDPDAVLSRAEAAVQDDRLVEALAELAALPPEGQAAMQPWADQAKARIGALAATTEIAAALGRE